MTVMLAMLVGALMILATTIISTNFQPQREVIAKAAVVGYAFAFTIGFALFAVLPVVVYGA